MDATPELRAAVTELIRAHRAVRELLERERTEEQRPSPQLHDHYFAEYSRRHLEICFDNIDEQIESLCQMLDLDVEG